MKTKYTLKQVIRRKAQTKQLRRMIKDFFKYHAKREASAPRIDLEKLSHAEAKQYPITIPVTGILFNQ